jgi:hypothetical protein
MTPISLRIRCDDLTGRTMRVWLNDLEITGATTSISLELDVRGISHATLSILPTEVVVDAQTLVALKALCKEPAA